MVPKILDKGSIKKLEELNNQKVIEVVKYYIELCKPAKATVITGSEADLNYVRELALTSGEETKLAISGHTIHFDGYYDQARDKEHTKVLLQDGESISKFVNVEDKDNGLKEVIGYLEGSMKGKEMLVCFFCLGPTNSRFSIPALQITDSAYVAHCETILYRPGYEEFKKLKSPRSFFSFIHSAGELDEQKNSKNIDQRRIYIDLEENRVLTVNNQYAGNSLGLKKLALRLALNKANHEDWLAEHMFLMGVCPEGKNRVTYFTGAFPSGCGKTSTAMMPGQKIIGDDIVYLKIGEDGQVYGVNIEQGIFGIIGDVNPTDDPVIYEALTTKRELIFSNVLVVDGIPYWLGMGKDLPDKGKNYSGNWFKGKKGPDNKQILPANKNARYTLKIGLLNNADPKLNDPNGVSVSGIIYGGRDSDTNVPVIQSLDWSHGVFLGATIESETTSATIGEVGVRKFNPMANLDFLVVPIGSYIKNHLNFGNKTQNPPLVFTTNYFLKKNDAYLNDKVDKKVWVLWMEGRVHNEYRAIETPAGFIPLYEDLKQLFKDVLGKEYTRQEYVSQFSIRVQKLLDKLDRVEAIYLGENVPDEFSKHFKLQRDRLMELKIKYNLTEISPFQFE